MNHSKYTLITGASTGIGYELAHCFARAKHNVVLVARNEEKLSHLANKLETEFQVKALIIPQDLTQPNAPNIIYETTRNKNIHIDILVNNAGIGANGEFAKIPYEKEMALIQLNIVSLVALCKLYIQDMAKQQSGKILNVASTAAFQPGPYMSSYYASKAFVLHFSEGLYQEYKKHGITISTLCPGATRTPFFENAEMGTSSLATSIVMMNAKKVAEIGYKGLMQNKAVIIPGLINKILAQSVRFTTRFLVRQIAAKLNFSR